MKTRLNVMDNQMGGILDNQMGGKLFGNICVGVANLYISTDLIFTGW